MVHLQSVCAGNCPMQYHEQIGTVLFFYNYMQAGRYTQECRFNEDNIQLKYTV